MRSGNRFLALTTIESEDDEQVNAVETVQEVVEITVDSGAAKSVWPSRKKGVERTKSKKANWRQQTEVPFELKETRDWSSFEAG